MPRARWRHAVIALTDVCPEFAKRLERQDVELIGLGKRAGHLAPYYPALWRLMRRLSPALVHTRNLAALEAAVPAWAARVPVRIHGEHGWDMQDPHGTRARYRRIRRVYRPFVSHYVALSQHLETYLQREVGIARDRVSQIYNGVDVGRFAAARHGRESIPGCPFADPHDWLVGTVGRMERVKDPMNLARAFVRAMEVDARAGRHLKLIMVGGGSERSELEAFFTQAGVRDKVWLAGERNDIGAVMRGLDCFVLPSLAEGISNTILEAMASGLPVIATAVGGNVELIESGMTGTLVLPARSDLLARAIVDYQTDPAVARRHGKAARRVAESRFSIDGMVADYVAMYERELKRAGWPVPPDVQPSARMPSHRLPA
jgi:sugar transferase (PEP-CTERM/EpsH1 system associated)